MPHFLDLTSLSTILGMAGILVSFAIGINRIRIVRSVRHFIGSFRNTAALVSDNERLTDKLAAAENRNIDWEAQFENVEKLRQAISDQLEYLKKEIEDIRKRLNQKDELIHILQCDRDALVTWGRLLIGQLHTNKIEPDYPAPALRSVISIPGPQHPSQ